MEKRRVVITGIGIVSPLGNTRQESWDGIKAGRSGIGKITRFDAATFPCQIAGEVRNFEVTKFIEAKEVKKIDLFSGYAIGAGQEAWDDAGLGAEQNGASLYEARKMGAILGVGIGGMPILERCHKTLLADGPRKVTPFLIPAMISNLAPGNLGIRFGLKGVNYTITSACASATHALGEAARMIAHGYLDLALSGGTESCITPIGVGGFCALKALSTRNDAPEKASRPFDRDRDGFVMGEGAAIFVLETLESARKRGAKIYCEVAGYGASCDAYHITSPSDDGEGAINCMKNALDDAGVAPTDVQYINAHGTSTSANDATETKAIKQVFGSWAKEGLLVSSTKSMTGHLLGAAGAVESAFTGLAIKEGVVPPTINQENPDPACDLDYVPNTARNVNIKCAMSNSFGFGGTNASVVLKAVS